MVCFLCSTFFVAIVKLFYYMYHVGLFQVSRFENNALNSKWQAYNQKYPKLIIAGNQDERIQVARQKENDWQSCAEDHSYWWVMVWVQSEPLKIVEFDWSPNKWHEADWNRNKLNWFWKQKQIITIKRDRDREREKLFATPHKQPAKQSKASAKAQHNPLLLKFLDNYWQSYPWSLFSRW